MLPYFPLKVVLFAFWGFVDETFGSSFCLVMAVPTFAVSAGFAAADKAGKDAEKPFSPLDNCGDDLWQLSCDCPQGYLMTAWDSLHELYPGDIGHVWFTRGMSYWADHGNIAYERLPDRERWMILKLARPLTVKIGNKTVKRGPYLAIFYPYFNWKGAGFICSMAIFTCADEGEVDTLFDEIDGRTDCEIYDFSHWPAAREIGGVDNELKCDLTHPAATRGVSCLEERKTTMTTRRDDKDQKAARELVQRFEGFRPNFYEDDRAHLDHRHRLYAHRQG